MDAQLGSLLAGVAGTRGAGCGRGTGDPSTVSRSTSRVSSSSSAQHG
jgi:hypothetical protein